MNPDTQTPAPQAPVAPDAGAQPPAAPTPGAPAGMPPAAGEPKKKMSTPMLMLVGVVLVAIVVVGAFMLF